MIYHFEEVSSTNDIAKDTGYTHGDIVCAERQTKGRGQRGHVWVSDEGLNLTFTAILSPKSLLIKDQFILSEVVALALVDTLAHYKIEAKIKWTNDIYVGDRKIVGVLIENRVTGSNISRSWVGIGINVNQVTFDPSLPNPTSMLQVSKQDNPFNRDEVLDCFYNSLMKWYDFLEKGEYQYITNSYIERMYRRGEWHQFNIKSIGKVNAMIEGIHTQGELMLAFEDGSRNKYLFGEVEFLIEGRD